MVIRVEPDLSDTNEILKTILPPALNGERVSFLVGAGQSFHVLARIRTQISRKRTSMRNRGVKPKLFNLMSTVHRETHDGTRYDCIIVWIEVRESHVLGEALDDLLAKEPA
jgi:hypothetical protein